MHNINREFKFNVEVNKVEREVQLEIPNPNYWEIQKSFYYLRDITLNNTDSKKELPVHIKIEACYQCTLK